MRTPKIMKAGNDPNCIHHEDINLELIGVCRHCGQVRNYRPKPDKFPAMILDFEPEEEPVAALTNRRTGSVNDESAAWAGIHARAKRAYRKRGEL